MPVLCELSKSAIIAPFGTPFGVPCPAFSGFLTGPTYMSADLDIFLLKLYPVGLQHLTRNTCGVRWTVTNCSTSFT